MPRYIIKLPCDGTDYYLLWSSVVDAPITYGMTLDEFTAYYAIEYGAESMRYQFPERMSRVDESGTSDRICRDSVERWTSYNCAGEDEVPLTFDELVDQWVRQPREPEAESKRLEKGGE